MKVRKCSILGCSSVKKNPKISLFKVPKNNSLAWNLAINKNICKDSVIKFVCAEHFLQEDIVSAYSIPSDVAIELGNRSKYRLKIGAIPSIFNSNVEDNIINYNLRRSIYFEHSYAKHYSKPSCRKKLFEIRTSDAEAINLDESELSFKHKLLSSKLEEEQFNKCMKTLEERSDDLSSFSELKSNFNKVVLPEGWATYFSNNEIVFYKSNFIDGKMQIEKQLVFKCTLEVCLYIYQLSVQMDNLSFKLEYPFSLKDVSQAIQKLNHKNICQGGPSSINFPGIRVKTATLENNNLWRHLKCPILIDRRKRCEICDHLIQYFRRCKQRSLVKHSSYIGSVLTPTRRRTLTKILNDKKKLKKSNTRLRIVIEKLNFELGGMQEKMKSLSDISVNQILVSSNLSDPQKILIQEIFKTSQHKNKKNRRYSEDWILLCILLKIRSSSTYNFLREQDILPLPCLRTIRKYLSLVKTKCGFDDQFFQLLKKKMSLLRPEQRHGMLVFDEVFLRESLRVDSQTLTYIGLEDFGSEVPTTGLKANHGLVFLFQSFAANFTQPIAVFASRGPVKGIVLTQLIIKAISLLENAGAKVDGLVSDGASSNRKLWSELGISGEKDSVKNKFDHPLDDQRQIFVFSDACHLIKNVRNRLYHKKGLRVTPEKPYIRWAHYIEVYKCDMNRSSNAPSRVCPKITERHLAPDNFSKMSVKLATQILSDSMAKGIEFYREYIKMDSLKNSYETQQFTDRFNKLFDTFNRKHPKEGIKMKSKDFEVLEDTLLWLDNWEDQLIRQKISKEEYLTISTAEGLRVTITSTIELSTYLLENCNFKYVLSSKFNQDRLEQFFGMARQVSGPNDHPCTATFLQVYKMLSVYSMLKPPKTGNCKILETNTTKISISDLKTVFNNNKTNEREEKLSSLKQKLDLLAIQEISIDNVFDDNIHNYYNAGAKDCVLYYICGYITKNFIKNFTCDVCRTAVIGKTSYLDKPEATLVNLKTKGGLIHPNVFVFNLLSAVELSFEKFCDNNDVFELTLENFFSEYGSIQFPCQDHKNDVLMSIISYYIITRMHQYTLIMNKNQNKNNAKKKKCSKLVCT